MSIQTFLHQTQLELKTVTPDDVGDIDGGGIYLIQHRDGKNYINASDNVKKALESRIKRIQSQTGIFAETVLGDYTFSYIPMDNIDQAYETMCSLIEVDQFIRI